MIEPHTIDEVTMAFPADVENLMVPYKDIPEEFRDLNKENIWIKLISDWFNLGLKDNCQFFPVQDIDPEKAYRHIKAILGSYQPKHEHKIACCAYLASLWFKKVEYKTTKNI